MLVTYLRNRAPTRVHHAGNIWQRRGQKFSEIWNSVPYTIFTQCIRAKKWGLLTSSPMSGPTVLGIIFSSEERMGPSQCFNEKQTRWTHQMSRSTLQAKDTYHQYPGVRWGKNVRPQRPKFWSEEFPAMSFPTGSPIDRRFPQLLLPLTRFTQIADQRNTTNQCDRNALIKIYKNAFNNSITNSHSSSPPYVVSNLQRPNGENTQHRWIHETTIPKSPAFPTSQISSNTSQSNWRRTVRNRVHKTK